MNNSSRKVLITMMLLHAMLNDEYGINPMDFDFESSQDETEESEDIDELEQDVLEKGEKK